MHTTAASRPLPPLPRWPQVLTSQGLLPANPALAPPPPPEYLAVQLDGRPVGHVRAGQQAAALVARLREVKAVALRVRRLGRQGRTAVRRGCGGGWRQGCVRLTQVASLERSEH
jgi:hypothetical protein